MRFCQVMEQLQSRMFQLGCHLFQCYLWAQGPVVPAVWCVLFCEFPEPLHPQGASSNFLALRIKLVKQLGSVTLYGVRQL